MNKKRYLAMMLAAGVAFSVSACGAPPVEPNARVELTMLAAIYSDGTKGLWQGYIDDFAITHPNINITLEMQSWENINDVIKTKIQAGQAPDILSIDAFSAYAQD
ncbi:MAG: extracellular solute-binding protein, partial [Micrococcales bacterium]|nr:extracellular solute-binding protein [Micrococcales bacterium]